MYKRTDGRWQEKVTINGERHTFTAATQRELKQKMLAFKEKASAGTQFTDILDRWQEEHFERISRGTRACYSPALKRAKAEFDGQAAKDITALEIDRSVRRMAKQGYSHQSVKIYLSTLRQAFDFAVLEGELDINPTLSVHLPKGLPKSRREVPDDLSLRKIEQSINEPFGLFLYFLLYTGLRRGEALALQWRDIDFEQKIIRVYKSIAYDGDRPEIKQTKTAAGNRDVILLDVLASHLKPGRPYSYIFGGKSPLTLKQFNKKYNVYALTAGLAHIETEYALRTRRGKQETYQKQKVVRHVTPHQLRHAYATILFEADVSDKDAQQLLGHSKISVTKDTYTHIRKRRFEETANKLNKATIKNAN